MATGLGAIKRLNPETKPSGKKASAGCLGSIDWLDCDKLLRDEKMTWHGSTRTF